MGRSTHAAHGVPDPLFQLISYHIMYCQSRQTLAFETKASLQGAHGTGARLRRCPWWEWSYPTWHIQVKRPGRRNFMGFWLLRLFSSAKKSLTIGLTFLLYIWNGEEPSDCASSHSHYRRYCVFVTPLGCLSHNYAITQTFKKLCWVHMHNGERPLEILYSMETKPFPFIARLTSITTAVCF